MTWQSLPGHRPGKKGHRVLKHLAGVYRAGLIDLIDAAGVDPLSAAGRKFSRLVGSMCRDGLVCQGGRPASYWITNAGREALARLDAGEPVIVGPGVPSARIFGRAA